MLRNHRSTRCSHELDDGIEMQIEARMPSEPRLHPRVRVSSVARAYFNVVRAKMILLAAEGLGNDEIAARLDVGRDVVSQWRRRFFEQRVLGLEERQRSGRPRVFPPRGGRAG